MRKVAVRIAWLAALALLGCGSSGSADDTGGGAGAGGAAGNPGGGDDAGGAGGGDDASADAGDETPADDGGTADGGAGQVLDPAVDGPYPYSEFDDKTLQVPATGDPVPMHCAVPTSQTGPYPVVVFAHGFQLESTRYYSYLQRLATYGYIACTADFPAPFTGISHVKCAKDVIGAIDWVIASNARTDSPLYGLVDADKIGASGHSLGGKLSILAAESDPRIKASLTLDPVNASTFCNPTDCPSDFDHMPVPIPTGYVGETTDQTGSFQACAPAADNFLQFYAHSSSPSLAVTVIGANHMSFLDTTANCLACGFCNAATATPQVVAGISHAMMVAFYERYLRGVTAYDDYLSGATAQSRYVTTGLATIESK